MSIPMRKAAAASPVMSYLSDFEHTKLDAQVYPGGVLQKHYISDPISGQRRVPKTKEWKVERLLGKGSFGEVRLEVHLEENERRAVKRIWASGSTFKMAYERELKALLEFSKPKYKESAVFVEFFGWFEDPESVYLAMEYVPLGDLEENVKAIGGTVKEAEVRDITHQILEGLKIMHLENFVHRDLKPKNVLVCQGPPRWWVKLADFGLSKRRTEETAYRTQTGTHAYMAPEILGYAPNVDAEGAGYTNAVDIWALGCIVYRLVKGAVPFPPGLSLIRFCDNESTFPSQGLALSELGVKFIRDLVVAYPSQRLTAQQALDHAWIGISSETSDSNIGHTIIETGESASTTSFGGYNTVTHPGLKSYGPGVSTPVVDPALARYGPPKASYHPPTVEDAEEETTVAHTLKADIASNRRQEQSPADATVFPRPDSQNASDDVEESEPTIKKPPSNANNLKSARPSVEKKETNAVMGYNYTLPWEVEEEWSTGIESIESDSNTQSSLDIPLGRSPSRTRFADHPFITVDDTRRWAERWQDPNFCLRTPEDAYECWQSQNLASGSRHPERSLSDTDATNGRGARRPKSPSQVIYYANENGHMFNPSQKKQHETYCWLETIIAPPSPPSPPLPRPQTFQSGDARDSRDRGRERGDSRLRKERRSAESDSDSSIYSSPRPASKSDKRYIVEPPSPPPSIKKPGLHSYSSAPPIIPNIYTTTPSGSQSMQSQFSRKESVPPIVRTTTYYVGDGFRGSRKKKSMEFDSESDAEPPVYSTRRTSSPRPEETRYHVSNGRSIPIPLRADHRDDKYARARTPSPPPGSRLSPERGSRGRQRQYYTDYHEPIVIPVRPKMSRRETGDRSSATQSSPLSPQVKWSPAYGPADVVYR
ncbi:hypothetical protein B7463_g6070, partial [Scytalidium lignicola]